MREARFVSDGGVHGLFTIAGRQDAPGVPARAAGFRIQPAEQQRDLPHPDAPVRPRPGGKHAGRTLQANLAANAASKSQLGIAGRFNTSGNDGTITRFGWKAQNKSLLMFAGEAYNVEQGVTNDLFPE